VRKKGMAIVAVMAMVLMGLVVIMNPAAADEATISKKWGCGCGCPSAWLGDYFTVIIDVTVPSTPMTFEDHLPEGLSYVSGTFMVDGSYETPTVEDHVVSYELTSTGSYQITFKVLYDSAVPHPDTITAYNWAYLWIDGCEEPEAEDYATIRLRPYCWFHKNACLVSTEDGDDIIEVFENVIWKLHIYVTNSYDVTLYDVVITDRLAAELEVDEVISYDGEDLDIKRQGNTKITWTIGELEEWEEAHLWMYVSTREKGKHQQYTSCGKYEWNSGAVLKFIHPMDIDDPNDDVQLSAHSEKLWVDVPGTWPGTPP
jgi:hypothetical protein